ncbi:hypothetical protein P154DRAFT_572543 [Amniculicola lignicola CBS 123094]|uniref:Uncharacterized protein n=1 Tax=Amniculicola lignicola CBS 123094 TaxID=1392246 RepID=A0A6A5WQF1_9PLEO|nr:hypothetical protein P154DRAFT_572543 [Amniculicola lignicola CBS 123094]
MSNEFVRPKSEDDVYTGIWINRLYGPIYGATLTLGRDHGGLLVAFLALYVAATGKSFWKITRFGLHSTFSSIHCPDGIYHQRQALLRNSESAPDTALKLLLVGFAWKNRIGTAGNWRRLFLPILTALTVSIGFLLAGIFSSRVTSSQANEVLLSGNHCGDTLDQDTEWSSKWVTGLLRYQFEKYTEDLAYATQCYQFNDGKLPRKCQTFAQPRIKYKIDGRTTCPFAQKICQTQTGNLALDSGYIKSNRDLGINSELEFLLRIRHQCAPLITDGYSELEIDPGDSSRRAMRYNYHEPGYNRSEFETYAVPITQTGKLEMASRADLGELYNYKVGTGDTQYPPVSELSVTDREVLNLFFLDSTNVYHFFDTPDLWFGNSTRVNMELNGTFASVAVGVLACRSEYMLCNEAQRDESRCINIVDNVSEEHNLSVLSSIWPNENDQAILRGILAVLSSEWYAQMEAFYRISGLPSLLASRTLKSGTQSSQLPENHWQKELEYTFQAELASLQSGLVENTRVGMLWMKQIHGASNTTWRSACQQQKTRSFEFYSFNILGLSMILVIGLVLMLMAVFLEQIAGWVDRIRHDGKPSYKQLEWETNSTLQLQRLAHESLGFGDWSHPTDVVPVTKKGGDIGILDFTDLGHPSLRHPTERESGQNLVRTSRNKVEESNSSLGGAEDSDGETG